MKFKITVQVRWRLYSGLQVLALLAFIFFLPTLNPHLKAHIRYYCDHVSLTLMRVKAFEFDLRPIYFRGIVNAWPWRHAWRWREGELFIVTSDIWLANTCNADLWLVQVLEDDAEMSPHWYRALVNMWAKWVLQGGGIASTDSLILPSRGKFHWT